MQELNNKDYNVKNIVSHTNDNINHVIIQDGEYKVLYSGNKDNFLENNKDLNNLKIESFYKIDNSIIINV